MKFRFLKINQSSGISTLPLNGNLQSQMDSWLDSFATQKDVEVELTFDNDLNSIIENLLASFTNVTHHTPNQTIIHPFENYSIGFFGFFREN